MNLSSFVWGALLLTGCASAAAPPALGPSSAQLAGAPSRPPALNVETSHIYLLSPGKDAVRVVVSR